MKKFLVILFLMANLSGCAGNQSENSAKFGVVETGEQVFRVEVADNNYLRQRGLMFRENLDADQGMIFLFENSAPHSFWMKNTLLDLDIIWINENWEIVDIQTVPPCRTENCPSYIPAQNAQYVLEIGAGKFRGKVGDKIKFNLRNS